MKRDSRLGSFAVPKKPRRSVASSTS
ncbi:hypothetical protein PENANT_c013G10901 [Penicillium antarcticum]|uniref:Uncharacterized protein n=1 Tax=Penicillium antarcticum TaxID=416450 RepID=A0A1V6Q4X1_9EURO|nr:hypothetical protein PENANT_c013G10901 [Penicillium antarcticum]